MNKFFIIISFLSISLLNAQNLKGVDFIVSNYPEFKNIDSLSNRIKSDFYSEKERVRAIYTWIANNIIYDDLNMKPLNFYIYSSEKELRELIEEESVKKALITFKFKKGVCDGYANLFKYLCDNLNIQSELIHGYAKIKVTSSNSNNIINNHTWNKVYIDNMPYLIDSTWSVNIIPNKNGYIRDINYDYFLANPNLFILSHYPENFKDSLIGDNISPLTFINYPRIYMPGYKDVQLIRPIRSKINKKIKTNTKFTFQVIKPVKEVSFYLGNKFYHDIPYNYKNNILTFDLNLEDTNDNNLTLYINNEAICSYWLE